MAELKTKKNDASVQAYIDAIEDEDRRADCETVMALMSEVTGEEPAMWGDSIVGFGSYHYRYDSGREGDWLLTGFSSRKQNLTLYIMSGFSRFDELMGRLGKFKTGKSCLYLKRFEDIDADVLRVLIGESVAHLRATEAGR
jgi:hypothetical protein